MEKEEVCSSNRVDCLWRMRMDDKHRPFCVGYVDEIRPSASDIRYSFNCDNCKRYKPVVGSLVRGIRRTKEPLFDYDGEDDDYDDEDYDYDD